MPSRPPTGANIAPRIRNKIIALLCSGHSINEVARSAKVHWLTVRAIQWANAAKVEERKQILAERSEHAAADALDKLHAKILDPKEDISASQLVPVFGVLVDKALALRADPTIHIDHSHSHIHAHINHSSFSDLLNRLPRRIQSPHLGSETQSAITQILEDKKEN